MTSIDSTEQYQSKMRLNITLAYLKYFLFHWYFFYAVWYVFETQFATPTQLGVIYAVAHLFTVVLELPTGALADLIGRKKTIMSGLLLQGLGWGLIGLATNVWWIWAGYLVNALGVALSSGSDTALHFDSLKELGEDKKFAQFSSKMYLISRFAMIPATFLGGYLYGFNQRVVYILPGLLVMLAGVLTLWNTEPKIDSEKFTLKNYIQQTDLGLKQLWKTPYIKALSLFYFLVGGITWYFVYFVNMPFAVELGFGDIERSWLLTGFYIFIAAFMYIFTHSKFFTRDRVLMMFLLVMVLGFIPSIFYSKLTVIIPFLFLQLLGSAREALLGQFVNDEFVSKYRATAVSALNMVVSLICSGLLLVGGRVIEVYNTKVMLTGLGVVSLVLVTPLTIYLMKNHKVVEADL